MGSIKKNRQMNIELLRIISMIMVVALHYHDYSSALKTCSLSQNPLVFIFICITEALSIVSVNCYLLISGYFLINSEFRLKKIISFWLEVFIFCVGIFLVMSLLGVVRFSLPRLIIQAMPVILGRYWFASLYFGLYILTPFINTGLKALSKKQYGYMLAVLFVILSLRFIIPVSYDYMKITSLLYAFYIYAIAGYIRLHFYRNIKKRTSLLIYILCSGFLVLSTVVADITGLEKYKFYLYDYASFAVVISSVALFMFFKELKLKENGFSSKIISVIAPLVFGVYLFHEHPVICEDFLYSKVLKTQNYVGTNTYILSFAVSVVLIFAAGLIVSAIVRFIVSKLINISIFNKKTENLN